MYEPIRQLIRENRLRPAMHAIGGLELSREHSSRLVTLERRLSIIEDKKISNLSEDRLLTIEENGLVEDMLIFLDKVEFPTRHERPEATTFTGAAAGVKHASNKRFGKVLIRKETAIVGTAPQMVATSIHFAVKAFVGEKLKF